VAAFTLVELLAVIAILSVLMAFLLPALGKAQAAARRVACLSHLRQTAMLTMEYASENGSHIIPWCQYVAPFDSSDNRGRRYWWYSVYLVLHAQAVPSGFKTKDTLFACPSYAGPQYFDFHQFHFTYGLNSSLANKCNSTEHTIWDVPRLSGIQNPATAVLYGDNWVHWEGSTFYGANDNNGGKISATTAPVVRHEGSACFAYVDGHGRVVPANETYQNNAFFVVQ